MNAETLALDVEYPKWRRAVDTQLDKIAAALERGEYVHAQAWHSQLCETVDEMKDMFGLAAAGELHELTIDTT